MTNGDDDSIARERLLEEVLTAKYNMVDVFKQAPAFMCVLRGPDHEFELVNERYLQLIGYREVVGLTVRQALPEIEGQGFFELLDSVYQSGETFTGTDMPVLLQRSHDKPMERRFVDLVYTALKDADGVINGILVHGIDQTERKQSEMALAEREEQLRLALEAADVGLWDVDVEKGTLFWPPRVKAMFGISPNVEVSMQDFYDGLHPEDLEQTSISYANATDPNLRTQYDAEYRTIGKEDGVIRWVAAKGRGIFNEANQCVRVIGTAIDVTQRKAADEALRKSEEQLRESDRRKDEFLAMLAHELRNPLSPISSAIEIMALSKYDVGRVQKYSLVIERQVKHMAALINDLLDVSRVKRGLVEIKKTPQDLIDILQHSIEQVKPVMDAKFQRLDTNYESTSVYVLGDEKRLIQIMSNVLNNAAKYTQEHGNIDLCVRKKNQSVIVEIIDNGIGISEADQAMVFELFAQARRDSDRSQGGLGIGLAIVKGLLDLHDGSIECFSEGLGRGSKFTITLPLIEDFEIPSKTVEISEPDNVSNQIIVVVDDNIDAATSLADILRLLNHQVYVEHDPSKALELIYRIKPTVCILDIGLPGIDGYEMARLIRKQPHTNRTVLIAVTGYGQEKDKEEAYKAGFDLHFVKPVDHNLLSRAIEDLAND